MTHTPNLFRYAFAKANWHADIVERALDRFLELNPQLDVDVFNVPGAFELPLLVRDIAVSRKYAAVVAAAFVEGGIYRHEFVARAVVDGFMRVGLDTGVPVLSVALTPHQYRQTDHFKAIFRQNFVEKSREAERAALMIEGLELRWWLSTLYRVRSVSYRMGVLGGKFTMIRAPRR